MSQSNEIHDQKRRNFLGYFAGLGLGSSLLPGVLWAQMQNEDASAVTPEMLKGALSIAGLNFPEADQQAMLQGVNTNLTAVIELRKLQIPNDIAPPFYFSTIVPGMKVNRAKEPFHMSSKAVKRPANLEEVAFWPVAHLAHLVRTKQVTSTELTKMYLDRLHKYNDKLHCVVSFTDELAMQQAKQADSEIASGHYKGPLHGIPWGAKDIIAVKGYKTTWGSDLYKDQVIDEDATVYKLIRDAGAVLVAKLVSGEMAQGDRWFGGQCRNPWNPEEGSGGSSAGPGSATGAGLVGFSIGTETAGSILGPSGRCGVTGLRPTFGRSSKMGVMALSWTQDRLGPMTRYAEDCALVLSVIAHPDGQDLSVSDIPFNWNASMDVKKLRVGYVPEAFDEIKDPVQKRNAEQVKTDVEAMGFKLIPVKVPEWTVDVTSHNVEMAAFFDEITRNGKDHELTNKTRGNSFRSARMMSAVDYLQSQRARTMMMMKLAEATEGVDVYLVPPAGGNGGPGGRGGDPAAAAAAGGGGRGSGRPQTVGGRHSNMANLACYPALSVPSGFNDNGTPTAMTFFARPFGETELLAFGKAYQDKSGHHLKHPNLS